ncbi:NrfD/PsrC family molybdoenzyme membrane anchor subunit [Bacteroidota bacterium]
MNEELIVSGRMNPKIDPILHVWSWEISIYLFLGGLVAGILFFASYYYIRGKEDEMKVTIKWLPLVTPILLGLGLLALLLDLHHKPYFWQLYTTIKIESPMSWGAWVLMLITPLSIFWAGSYLREVFPGWDWKFQWLYRIETFARNNRRVMAWMMVFLSIILGIYTGILLSAFNARPLWNTSILGPLFLVSGMSAGAALIMWWSDNPIERERMSKIDLVLIGIELFLIIHMFMGFKASTQVQIDAADMFLGGQYTLPFWIIVVFLGMVVPALLEFLEFKGRKVPMYIPALLILIGNISLRFIIVYAGQASRYLY